MMIVIGLVGESGTGKTTISGHLEKRGAGHINADTIAHELLAGHPGIIRRVREEWGEAVFSGGAVDRKKLGAEVFSNPRTLAVLNRILHPPVLEECRKRIEEYRSQGRRMVVVDAALLLEVDLPFETDCVVALRAGRDEQVRRLMEKGGVTREEIAARLENQSDLEKSFYRADVVVDTNKSLVLVLEQIDMIVDGLLEREGDEG
jgi:dephospho-CoA kinase